MKGDGGPRTTDAGAPAEALEERLGRLLRDRGWSIAVAETTTGGIVSSRIVGVPGSSEYFEMGIVAYSTSSKIEVLGITDEQLEEHGAVSEETALSLAEGARRVSGATVGLAETGIAGPIRGQSPKPIGSACLAVCGPPGNRSESCVFAGDRQEIRDQIAARVLEMAISYVENMGVSA
ncbi:MAG: CinA family protein [Candidatus Latescibacteria bacterium]|nr:CinA family protein [Candidatus Latescibacterota bacterium]